MKLRKNKFQYEEAEIYTNDDEDEDGVDDEYMKDSEVESNDISEELCLTENNSTEPLESAIDSVRIR